MRDWHLGTAADNFISMAVPADGSYGIKDGVVYSSSGDGKIPFVDTRDIAAVAVITLTQPGHTGKNYVVTGGENTSYREATAILSKAIGKSLRFIDEPPDEAPEEPPDELPEEPPDELPPPAPPAPLS
jgi:uncharacterized protein YbjT (DUF2867 family)